MEERIGMLQERIVKLEKEKRSVVEVIQSVAPIILSVGYFEVEHLMAKEEDTMQQEPAQAKKQTSVIQSSKVGSNQEALSGHELL
jgi:hypothetical protein